MESNGLQRVGDVLVRQAPHVVEATIDRPRVFNALNDAVVSGLERALDIAEETEASVFVLRGAGSNFCSGADLEYASTLFDNLERGLFAYIDRLHSVCDRLADGPFISLALVEGHALAGGYEILTACDMAVATTNASIGDRHLEYALASGLGASVRVARHLTSKQARYLAFTGETISGEQAARWGLVSHAWPAEDFEHEAQRLVDRLASRNRKAVQLYKRMLLNGERQAFAEAMQQEQALFREYQTLHRDARDGIERFKARP
jgi:enoyl-CoA hydratase/carnithine racemase